MMNDDEKKFYVKLGRVLKEGRLRKRMSLRYASEAIGGKTKSSLMRYEDGDSKASLITIKRLCDLYDLNLLSVISLASAHTDFDCESDATINGLVETSEEKYVYDNFKRLTIKDQIMVMSMISSLLEK